MPKKICNRFDCGASVAPPSVYCTKHTQHTPRKASHTDKRTGRATAYQRGYGHKWRKARLIFLKRNPLCVHCLAKGVTTSANEVDHIIRHSGSDDPLFWDRTNWQALCKSCHSTKTRRESHLYAL